MGQTLSNVIDTKKITRITTRNADFQVISALKQNREKRRKTRLCFVEGVHPVEQAVANGFLVHAFIFENDKRLSGWAHDMMRKANPEKLFALPRELMRELSGREETSELIALVYRRDLPPEALPMAPNPLVIVCDRPGSPGNLGAIVRSADAMSAGLIITGHACDIYDPQCVRASVGTVFSLPFCVMESHGDVADFARVIRADYPSLQIVGTSAKAALPLYECDFTRPTFLLIGNETYGLSKNYKEICDTIVNIPINGAASSLNAACAASICLYEVMRQRGNRMAVSQC